MALVQMRTPGGSYSMVDENVVRVYEAEGWVLTSELPEFKTKNVTYYDEARKTVTTTKGEEKPVEEVIEEPQMGFREERKVVGRTASERAQQNRTYTSDEWQQLVNASIDDKLRLIKENSANGMRLTSSQKYYLDKQFKLETSQVNTAQDEGKKGRLEEIESGPLKPGEAGYGIDTWYEFLGYGSENDAMRDFVAGKITPAQIRRAEAEIQPDPADILVDQEKIINYYNIQDSDFARTLPGKQAIVSRTEAIINIENSDFGRTPPGQEVIKELKEKAESEITVSGESSGNANLGTGTSAEEVSTSGQVIDTGDTTVITGDKVGDTMSTKYNQFNNIPEGALLVQSDADKLYLMYEVPGQGTLFQGRPIWIFYEVKDNDLYEAGILTPGAPYEINMMLTEEQIDGFVYGGNTADLPGNDPRTGRAPHPFTSFVENVSTQAQIAPWILDVDSVKLLAEAALEGREVTEAEWRMTNWYQTHSEAEREWQRLYYADPTTAQNTVNDYKIQVSRALQAAGVTGGFDPETGMERAVPDALAGWIASKWVSGQWTESYTTEQLALFADPFRSGVRDVELGNYIATAGVDGLERTAEQEDRVRQLYTQWLGPVFGKLTDQEVAQQAGRIRNDPDFEQALIEQLKNNRLALFPQYTNPELTYNDIATPWRNLTTSVWGKAADETQSWWQDMVASNNFTEGTATLRSKGLEQNVDQVTIEATEALQKALGQGSTVTDFGVNR